MVRAWYRGAWWLWLLRPLELLFRAAVGFRLAFYRAGWATVYRAPVPVVVVGNISVGGTGKTPIVIALVEYLQQRGIRVGVVSRGYGALNLQAPRRVDSGSSARECGDEPVLIYQRTGCPCVVAPSRVDAVRELLLTNEVDLVLSDDGLQHYALGRDMEIAVLDEQRDVGNGFCLPAGPLREPATRLNAVDYVLYRGSDNQNTGVRYNPDCLKNVDNGDTCPPDPGALGRAVFAVAGIGQPEQFGASLQKLGFEPEPHYFTDHHDYSAADFARLTGKPIIMTEKDAVKCAGLAHQNAWYLKINAQLPQAVTDAVAGLVQR